MDKLKELKNKLLQFWKKTEPARQKTGKVFGTIGHVLRIIGQWLYRLRGLFLCIPVVLASLWLAAWNTKNLPEQVGILIQEAGDYRWMVERSTAVTAPLLVTAACLLLMLLSRKTVYPWLISVFSLVLPLLIYVTNVFPA